MKNPVLVAAALLLFCAPAARAELAVAANDGKQLLAGETTPWMPDSISVIDLSAAPPRVIGEVQAPASMIGSPNAVAIPRSGAFAIVTAAQKYDPAHPENPPPDDKVSVIDLADPAHPKVLQTVTAGATAGGVSISPDNKLVLVASKSEDAIFAFTLAGKTLIPAGRVALGAGAAPTDIVFAPDGRHAYAVAWGVTRIMELAVDGATITRTGQDVATGHSPYGAVITPDGNWLINTNVGGALGGTDKTGTITMVDLKAHRLALSLTAGVTPEHVALTPDGKYMALVLANGAATSKTSPRYDDVLGILRIYAVGPGTLTEVAEAPTCHWAQGATWSRNGQLILQQCAAERTVIGFRFDGHALVRDRAVTLSFGDRPGSISTPFSR